MANQHTNHVTSATSVPTTTETVVAILSAFTPNNPQGEGVYLDGSVALTAGTAATQAATKVYRAGSGTPVVGSGVPAGATQVGNTQPETVAAGNLYTLPINALDSSAAALGPGSVTYFATVVQTAATGNGSVSYAIINGCSCTISE